jgi:DNA-binding HxlR family transcriptional regulator
MVLAEQLRDTAPRRARPGDSVEEHDGWPLTLLENAQVVAPADADSMTNLHAASKLYIIKLTCYCQPMPSRTPKDRSYGQFCGLARALDVVGDRWTLLIVRELLVGPHRFGELQTGLPGIATNLLTQRLRQLAHAGAVERRLGKDPADGTSYALTSRGEDLREAVEALVRWSAPLMACGRGNDASQPRWLAVALPALLRARVSRPTRIGLETGGEHLVIEAGPTGATATLGRAESVHARLTADTEVILAMAAGYLDVRSAVRRGAKVSGSRKALESVFRIRGPSS